MKAKNIRLNLIVVLLLLFATIITLFGGVGQIYAAENNYSNVLDDLRKDSNFNIADYPSIDDDYSLQVIQIAESTGGELFIYVYQPAAKTKFLTATQVNMSLSESIDGTVLYDLTLLSNAGVLQKYRVDGVKVLTDEVRYYNITSIYRTWDKDIDEGTGNDNTKDAVFFAVDKLYRAETVDGAVNYDCRATEVVEVIDPFVDFVSFYDGLTWATALFMTEKFTDLHYIAFSTDRAIDTLKAAKVTYRTQSYTSGRGISYGALSDPQYVTLTGEMGGSTPNGSAYSKYTWKSIMRASDFVKSTDLTEATKATVSKSEFVVVFLTTSYSQRSASDAVGHYTKQTGTKVSNVAILRLEFETDGKVYNLGTLMDQQTGDDIPGNQDVSKPVGFWSFIWRCIVRLFKGTATLAEQIVAVVAIFFLVLFFPILLVVLSFVFPAFGAVMKKIFKVIGKVLLWLLKGLWWLVKLPFRGIAALIRRKRGG